MEQNRFDRQIELYIQSITPVRGKRKRWKQYNACKDHLLQLIPTEKHDEAIKKLANRLHL